MNLARPRLAPVVLALAAIALLAAWTLARREQLATATTGAPVAPQPGPCLSPAFAPTWGAGMTMAARQAVSAVVAAARPDARRAMGCASHRLLITARPGGCGQALSCVIAHGDGLEARFDADVLARAAPPPLAHDDDVAAVRFVILHELGHAVDGLLVGPTLRVRIDAMLRAAPAQAICRASAAHPCVPLHEQLADEWARYAGRYDRSLSTYETPDLLGLRQMRGIVAGVLAGPS